VNLTAMPAHIGSCAKEGDVQRCFPRPLEASVGSDSIDTMWEGVRGAVAAMPPNFRVVSSADDAVGVCRSVSMSASSTTTVVASSSGAGIALCQIQPDTQHVGMTRVIDAELMERSESVREAVRALVGSAGALKVVPSTAGADACEALCDAAGEGCVAHCIAMDLLGLYCGVPSDILEPISTTVAPKDSREASQAELAMQCDRTARCFVAVANVMESIAATAHTHEPASGEHDAHPWLSRTGASCLVDVQATPRLYSLLQQRSERLRRAAGDTHGAVPRARLHPAFFSVAAPAKDTHPDARGLPAALRGARPSDGAPPKGNGNNGNGGAAPGAVMTRDPHSSPPSDLDSEAASLSVLIRRVAASTLRWQMGGRFHGHRYSPLPAGTLRSRRSAPVWRRRADGVCSDTDS